MSTADTIDGGEGEPLIRRDIDAGTTDSVTVAVVDAVAAAGGVDAADLDATLHEAIDAEALASLLDHAGRRADADWEVTFELAGHEVTVHGDGRVLVR